MKQIPLTQGKVALVDDYDYRSLSRFRWRANKRGNTYYAMRNSRKLDSKQEPIYMHRIILNAPGGVEIDHINGNGFDNRRSNLRLCTHAENQRHQQLSCRNKTGYKGVAIVGDVPQKPFRAYIRVDNKQIHLGCHRIAEAAARAYDIAALKYHGEFALTNEKLGLY